MSPTLPRSLYYDDARYREEREAIFGREWMILGRTDELAPSGGYVAEEIAGYPVFIVLDGDGHPWGYHNICPHRGGPILFNGRGCTDSLTCQYHGWRFSFEGALVDAPGFDDVPEVGPGLQRLSEISMGRWAQLLWISLSGTDVPLTEAIGSLAADCHDIDFDAMRFTGHTTATMRCNWKLFIENYLESYHVSGTHGILETAFDMNDSRVSILDDRTTAQIAATHDGSTMRWYFLYPNVLLQVLGSTLCWTQVLPRGPHETLLAFDFFAADGADDSPLRTLCARLVDEDRRLCEAVQVNMSAGIPRNSYLSPVRESAVGWFRNKILMAVDLRSDAS